MAVSPVRRTCLVFPKICDPLLSVLWGMKESPAGPTPWLCRMMSLLKVDASRHPTPCRASRDRFVAYEAGRDSIDEDQRNPRALRGLMAFGSFTVVWIEFRGRNLASSLDNCGAWWTDRPRCGGVFARA
jgi:hypothetical protein